MNRRALYFFLAAILLHASLTAAQAKQTSKQAVENRLKSAEKEKVSPAIEQAIHALNAAGDFAQAAISPDGKKSRLGRRTPRQKWRRLRQLRHFRNHYRWQNGAPQNHGRPRATRRS